MKNLNKSVIATAIFAILNCSAYAGDDVESAQVRIRELEKQMQQMAEQLKAVQAQLAKSSQENTAEKDAPKVTAKNVAQGNPVEASFKNGLIFKDATGDWSLRLFARAQVDYRHFSPDEVAADTFSMRRARIGVNANFYDDFSLRIEGEFSESPARMNDGYLDYTHFKSAMIRLGQFKTMYGLERSQGAMDLNFMERAMTESLLGSVFDRGIMLHGAPLLGTYYHLAYVNGSGQNTDESNVATATKSDGKDWSLHAVADLAQWAGWKDHVVHVGGFHAEGKQAAGSSIPTLRTDGRGATFFSTSATGNNTFKNPVYRSLNGFESSLAYGSVKYQGEYVLANFDGEGFNRNMTAWYTSLQWLVFGEQYSSMYTNGAFVGITPKNNFRYGQGGWGALELGARYTHFDASDFKAVAIAANYTDVASEWTLGAKWVLNPNAQVQLNYVNTRFGSPITVNGKADDQENAMDMRVQFAF